MKKVLVSRLGAFGDVIHCSHIPRLLKEREGFDYVGFQYNLKGMTILKNNPFIDEHILFDPSLSPMLTYPISIINKRLKYLAELGSYDKVIDLQNSIEGAYIAMENMSEYYLDTETRRKKYGGHNYYDQSTIFAGYPQHVGMIGELFFSDEEEAVVQGLYKERYAGKFVIICNLSGTSKHKVLMNAEQIIKTFLDRHKEAVCILTGDEEAREHISFEGDRIVNRAGQFDKDSHYPFRQSMLMTKYANLVIGGESGIMVASTLLGTPTVQLMGPASIKNHGGDFHNDYSLQAPIACSPCHKGPYEYVGCPKIDYLGSRYPACIKFDVETILNRMEQVYQDQQKEVLCDN